MKNIIEKGLENSYSYIEYRKLIADLIAKRKSTGAVQTESLLNYSVLNDKRMNRLDKTLKLTLEVSKALKKCRKEVTWLVLSEGWCGDAAQSLPLINKIAEASAYINLKIALRDENDSLMDLFLTKGTKSIPKLIALNNQYEVLATWGPRPSKATKMVEDYKEIHGKLDPEFKRELQVWYNKDKGYSIQDDFLQLLKQCS